MKKLKAVCALSLAGLLLFSLSGCGGEKKEPVKAGTQKLPRNLRSTGARWRISWQRMWPPLKKKPESK